MAEETENGGLIFGIRLDNSQLAKDVELSNKLFESIGKSAEETGKVIQHWFSDMQIVPKIDTGKFKKDLDQVQSAMAESSTKGGQGYNKAFSDLYVAAGNAGAKVRDESRQTVTSVSDDLGKLNSGFNAITGLASKMFLGVSAMNIGMQVYQTRSYFQDAESSMKVFLGDAEKGSKFISELKDYAFYNMFEFKDLVGASKQLIAYGSTTKEILGDAENGVTGILDKLSNIATGTGASLNDMIAMYNKAKSVGKVDSQGLESWAAKGVLVKQTLKEMGEVVGSTGVSFKQLEKVLAKVTGEGGMFHDLMKEQLNNLSASYAQLQDNMTAMYEEMGEKAEPIMKGAIDLAGVLVENYQDIASAIVDVAKVYGAYKLVDMSGVQGFIGDVKQQMQQAETENILVETYKEHSEELQKMLTAEQAHSLEMSDLEEGTKEYAAAIQDMITSEKDRTESALKSVSTELDAETARKAKLDELKATTEAQIETYKKSGDTKKVEALQTRLETVSEEQNASAKKINELQTKKTLAAVDAETAARNREKLTTMQSTAAINKNTVAMTVWNKATTALGTGIKKLGATLKATLLSNPYALAIAGAVALVQAIYNIIEAENAREIAQKNIDEAKGEGYKKAKDELEKNAVPMFRNIEKLTEGTEEYKKAVADLVKKYPSLADALGDEYTKAELLSKGYDAVTAAIIKKNKQAEVETAIEKNKSELTDKQSKFVEEFASQLEEQGVDALKASRLEEEMQKALIDGFNFDQLSDEIKEIFANDSTWFGNFSNIEGTGASLKERFKWMFGMDTEYQQYTSHLQALFEQLQTTKKGYYEAAKAARANGDAVSELTAEEQKLLEKQRELDAEQKKKSDEYWGSAYLKGINDRIAEIKGELEGMSRWDYAIIDLPENQKHIKELWAERNKLQRELKQANKDIFGLDYNAVQQAYNKQINDFKSFAEQYTAIEIKRQNEIDKLNQQRQGKGANNAIIDMQISDANQKAADDVTLLMAKYYNVSKSTAAEIKTVFDDALSMPVEDAKDRLAEITTRLAKIADAASKGNNIATKEEQARLAAEKAGLEQNIAKSRERKDFSEEQKKYEDFYAAITPLVAAKEEQLAKLRAEKEHGTVTDDYFKTQTKNIENAYVQQAGMVQAEFGMDNSEMVQSILEQVGAQSNAVVQGLTNNIEQLRAKYEELMGHLGDGYEVGDEVLAVRKNLEDAMKELQSTTEEQMDVVYGEILLTMTNIQTLKERAAKGENVSKELALQETRLKGLKAQWSNLSQVQSQNAEASKELTENQRKAIDIMANQAKWKKIQGYYDKACEGVNQLMDGIDGLSDETKETVSTLMTMGDSAFQIVGALQAYALGTIQAEKTAAVEASTAIATAEKASVILAIISAAIQAVMAIVRLFNKHGKTAKAEKNIKNLESQIKDLDRAYDKLGKSIEDAYAADATPLIEQQDTLLAQKQALLRQQIAEEKSKKNKKQDADQIREWEREIEDIQETRNQKQQTITEKLLGKDYKSVLEDFSSSVMSAMDDAETSVEDAVKNISKSIKKSAVQQQLNAKLQPITKQYAETLGKAMTDGVLDETEKQVLSGLERSIATISEDYLGKFDDLWDKAEAEERNAVSGGITNMSQDTAEEMNGRLTQIQSHTFSITENVKMLTDFSSRQLTVLQAIHVDTGVLVATTRAMKATIDDIQIKGVKLKA